MTFELIAKHQPFGNAEKNVATSLLTASGLLSNSCTYSVITPPGEMTLRNLKNSCV